MFGTLEYYGVIKGGRLILDIKSLKSRQQELAGCKDGTQVYEKIGRLVHTKTDAQLRGFWGVFIATCIDYFNENGYDTSYILKLDRPTGIPIYGDLLKEYMYNVCPVFDEEGNRITIGSNKMTLEKMCRFYDNCCDYAASQWGIYIPECDKDWRQKEKPDPFEKFRKE